MQLLILTVGLGIGSRVLGQENVVPEASQTEQVDTLGKEQSARSLIDVFKKIFSGAKEERGSDGVSRFEKGKYKFEYFDRNYNSTLEDQERYSIMFEDNDINYVVSVNYGETNGYGYSFTEKPSFERLTVGEFIGNTKIIIAGTDYDEPIYSKVLSNREIQSIIDQAAK